MLPVVRYDYSLFVACTAHELTVFIFATTLKFSNLIRGGIFHPHFSMVPPLPSPNAVYVGDADHSSSALYGICCCVIIIGKIAEGNMRNCFIVRRELSWEIINSNWFFTYKNTYAIPYCMQIRYYVKVFTFFRQSLSHLIQQHTRVDDAI